MPFSGLTYKMGFSERLRRIVCRNPLVTFIRELTLSEERLDVSDTEDHVPPKSCLYSGVAALVGENLYITLAE